MLKGISPILSPDLLKILMEMGRSKMRGGDQIEIVNTAGGQRRKDIRQFFRRYDPPLRAFSADIIVLAENTAHIAAAEKDGAASALSAQTGFLSKMRSRPGNDG